MVNTALKPLDPKECEELPKTKMVKALQSAYTLASKNHDLDYYKGVLQEFHKAEKEWMEQVAKEEAEMARVAEEKAKAAEEAEKEEEEEEAAKKEKKKKAPRKSKDGDVEMEDAAEAPKSSKKRKKEAESEGEGKVSLESLFRLRDVC